MENPGNGKWKHFDFGSDLNKTCEKRKKSNNSTKSNIGGSEVLFNFSTRLTPNSLEDLSVHPKKIEEIKTWLNSVINQQNLTCAFLLLSGPAGSAKTTTLKMLCKTMAISVLEWINPVPHDYELVKGSNQINMFMEFLSDAKWNSLFDTQTTRKVVLVKDIPNAIVHQPEELSNILEQCCKLQCHIVFICTDASSTTISLARKLFTDHVIEKYNITHIRFNPCAPSLMKKAVKRLHGGGSALRKQHSTIDTILASSLGDIRNVMNQFCFLSSTGNTDPAIEDRNTVKKARKGKTTTFESMPREEHLGLFHGLGRVLNPKRKNLENTWRLNGDVGKLVDEFSVQPALFVSFLFENYLRYFGDVYEASNAALVFSFSVNLLDNRTDKEELLIYGLWISVLGAMIYNEHKVSKWNQIKKPTKICCDINTSIKLHPMDHFYYDIIKNTNISHNF